MKIVPLILLSVSCLLGLPACSSVGVYDVRQTERPSRAPSEILVERFSAKPSNFSLGSRPASEKKTLSRRIVGELATQTASQIRAHAARSSVLNNPGQIHPGVWVVRGEIRKVDQGSRALRTGVGLGMGRTTMKTHVSVFRVSESGWTLMLRFKTTGASGLEPGVGPGVAVGGVSAVGTTLSAAGAGLAGVSSDIDRTAYEISAVISDFLNRHRLLPPGRRAVAPRMRGSLPTTIDPNRIIPAPLRPQT